MKLSRTKKKHLSPKRPLEDKSRSRLQTVSQLENSDETNEQLLLAPFDS